MPQAELLSKPGQPGVGPQPAPGLGENPLPVGRPPERREHGRHVAECFVEGVHLGARRIEQFGTQGVEQGMAEFVSDDVRTLTGEDPCVADVVPIEPQTEESRVVGIQIVAGHQGHPAAGIGWWTSACRAA